MNARFIPALLAFLLLSGCHPDDSAAPRALTPPQQAAAANALFLNQKTFDPWVLTSTDPKNAIPAYIATGQSGFLFSASRVHPHWFEAGKYINSQLQENVTPIPEKAVDGQNFQQTLNIRTGVLTTKSAKSQITYPSPPQEFWPRLWDTSDIVITGDPEAQQVTHANLFYLLSSASPGGDHSIPPMGLSSNIYGGHIFWDAEVWMFPALVVQHPDYAKSIIEYRFKLLGQAKKNAKAHGFAGAEYPWESADTGVELVGEEFAKERHITADVGWAAWQYYLWTDDKKYLQTQGWPVLKATADYWVSRVLKGVDGKYHIKDVLGPDETGGIVDDDAWTNGIVQANLQAATLAARAAGQAADPRWKSVADALYFPNDTLRGIPAENNVPLTDRFAAKQADTLLRCYPLRQISDPTVVGKMLDFYTAHTIKNGPAMTGSIEAIVAARIGRAQASLDLFHDSYRPFMRGPWDAFSEKRSSSRVYFCTGMGGCVQSVLYGFAGLQIVAASETAAGTKIAGDGEASLYADPHLPPGWGGLRVKGVRFRGKVYEIAIAPGNKVRVTAP